jgi:hypothetical protein
MSDLEPDLDLNEESDLSGVDESDESSEQDVPEEDFEISEDDVELDSNSESELEPEAEEEPEPEGPLELKLFQTHQWNNDSIVLKSSTQAGEEGYFLIRVIAESLRLSEKLIRVELNHTGPCWEEYPAHVAEEKLPFCSINDYVIQSYHQDLLHEFYDQLNGRSISQPHLLNLWMRAWGSESTELFELIQKSHSLAVVASLVERGANPLAAIKLT